MSAIGDLLDVNVWLAFSVGGHPHHPAALAAWRHLSRPSFCRVTNLGLMRLLCNPQVMGNLVFTASAAWAAYEKLLATGAVHFVEEPASLEVRLKLLVEQAKVPRDFWTDSYLAAFAQSTGMRLVSFDSAFARFKNLDCLVLKSQA